MSFPLDLSGFPGVRHRTGATENRSIKNVCSDRLAGPRKSYLLGFANFHCRFIHDYSWMAVPLSKLTFTKLPLLWTPEEEEAFARLTELFSTSPVIAHLDTNFQLLVTRVGTVFAQQTSSDQKLHPCAFFSLRLSPVT